MSETQETTVLARIPVGSEHVIAEGTEAAISTLRCLVAEAQDARASRAAQFSRDGRGYYVVFYSPQHGMGNMFLRTPQPLDTFKRVMALQHGISKDLQGPVCIVDWFELEEGSDLITAPAGSIPAPANLVIGG